MRLLCCIGLILFACEPNETIKNQAKQSITAEKLKLDISTLSSNEFLGRSPATDGEKKSVEYLKKRYQEIGLKGLNNQFTQNVPLIQFTKNVKNSKFQQSNSKCCNIAVTLLNF